MPSVEVKPGDTLNIVWETKQKTVLGETAVKSQISLSYDQLLSLLNKKKSQRSKKSKSPGRLFSRVVGLTLYAVKHNRWTNGAATDPKKALVKLVDHFDKLEPNEYSDVTTEAMVSLQKLLNLVEGRSDFEGKYADMVADIITDIKHYTAEAAS